MVRRIIGLIALLAVCIVTSSCGNESANGANSPNTVELHATPDVVRTGESVALTVENGLSRRTSFGLGGELLRFVDGRWRVVRSFQQPVPAIRLRVAPGDSGGPRYSKDIVDRLEVGESWFAGRYRYRRIFRAGDREVRAHAAFRVRRT